MLKTRIDMKNNLMQLVRLVAMVLAVAAAAGGAEALRRTDFRGRMAMTAATVRASGAATTPLTVGKFCRTLCDSVLSRPVFCYLCILFEGNYDGSKG